MKVSVKLILFVGGMIGLLGSCSTLDADPELPQIPISRLYVATSDYQTNEAAVPYNNIFIISPADSLEFDVPRTSYNSSARGGGAIYFNPYAQMVFQASQNLNEVDTVIYSLNYTITDTSITFQNKGRLGNRLFKQVRGMTYFPVNSFLYVYDQTANGIFMLRNPANMSSYGRIERKYFLPETISGWALTMKAGDLYMSRPGENGGISIFEGITNKRDTLNFNFAPSHTLTVSGSKNIRGMSLDTVKNILALTDYEISGANSTGKIYIFENVSNLKGQTVLTPTRTIAGVSTGLQEPVDVAIDSRNEGHFLYVADQKSKRVYRFNLKDDGNVAPNATYTPVNNLTPVSISLDAR